ncbi:unnamed protein product [Caenorhabditis nigoni]
MVVYRSPYACNFSIIVRAFTYVLYDSFDPGKGRVLKYFNAIDSIISSIVPSIFLPFLTLLLVIELKKARANRSKLFSSTKTKESQNTTRLVFYFTLAHFVAIFPLGVASAMMYFFLGKPGFLFLVTNVSYILEILFTANTLSHFIVCFLMSSQYMETMKNASYCRKKILPRLAMANRSCVA